MKPALERWREIRAELSLPMRGYEPAEVAELRANIIVISPHEGL